LVKTHLLKSLSIFVFKSYNYEAVIGRMSFTVFYLGGIYMEIFNREIVAHIKVQRDLIKSRVMDKRLMKGFYKTV
jgi:hypothetical protein